MFRRKWAKLGWLQAEVAPVFGFGWSYANKEWKSQREKNQYDFIAL